MLKKPDIAERILNFIGSKHFFFIIVGLFILQSVWIGLSNNYGSPHDEKFHFGLIQVFADQGTPFIHDQPPSFDQFGDTERTPSYLYHYLMSFPYKLISLVSSDMTLQIIMLRLINIALIVVAIFFLKRILDILFKKSIIRNLSLFAFVMIPIVPYVASGISYENLMILGGAISFYLSLKLIDRFSYSRFFFWVAVLALTSLVKYAFLPIAVGLFVGIVLLYLVQRKRRFPEIKASARDFRSVPTIMALILALIGTGLALERYGGNVISYGSPVPDCARVLSADRCQAWGPWQRNELARERNEQKDRVSLPRYALTWLDKMQSTTYGMYRSSVTRPALPALWLFGWTTLIGTTALAIFRYKKVLANKGLLIILVALGFYAAVLFATNYRDYRELGIAVAIQGRYMILAFPLLLGMGLYLLSDALKLQRKVLAVIAAGVWMLCLLNGGVVTYVIRTDATWWWPSAKLQALNDVSKAIVEPLVIGE